MRKIFGIILGLSLAGSSTFASGLICRAALVQEELSHGMKPEYTDRFLTDRNTNKVVEVTNQAAITNQGKRGFCHMYSLYAEMVREYKNRNNGQDPNISIFYWTYFHWLGRAISTAQNPTAGLDIPEGNWYENSFDIIKRVGVISNEAWARVGGKTDIQTPEKNVIELGQLKSIVAKAHIEKALVNLVLQPVIPKGKTRGDYFTAILDNPNLSQQLKSLVLRKERESKIGQTQLSTEQIQILKMISKGQLQDRLMNKEQIASLINNLNKDIAKSIETEFNLMYFGQRENPLGMDNSERIADARKLFPEVMQKTVSLTIDGTHKGPIRFAGQSGDHLFFTTPLDRMVGMIKEQIDSNNSVWIGYEHDGYYVDNKTGGMSIQGMSSKPSQTHVPQKQRNLVNLTYGGHAVQIVGYELNEHGQIIAFKIQNSWGEELGKKGYYRMDISYFRAYIMRITVRDEKGLFNQQTINAAKVFTQMQNRKGRLPQ